MVPPNILLIFPDQHRGDWTELNPTLPLRTPNLCKIANEGVEFTNAICPSPVCSPSRTCLASGREYDNCNIIDNGQNHPLDFPTIYELLRDQAGYHTMTCGKLDLRHPEHSYGHDGQHIVDGKNYLKIWGFSEGIENGGKLNGWQTYKHQREKIGPYMSYLEQKGQAIVHVNDFDHRKYHTKEPTRLSDQDYADNWIGREAVRLISNAPQNQPWFLQVNFNGPHSPMDVTESMRNRWKDVVFPQPIDSTKFTPEENQGIRQNYAAMIENIDRWTGTFLETIQARGELENTIIVYSSDHGEMLGEHNLINKSVPYQGAIRVPLIISGPQINMRGKISTPVPTLDLSATILDWAGLSTPGHMDSKSLNPFLTQSAQKEIPPERRFVRSGLKAFRVVMDFPYKLITGYPRPKWDHSKSFWKNLKNSKQRKIVLDYPVLLFNLQEDPDELQNIAQQHPEIVDRMKKVLVRS